MRPHTIENHAGARREKLLWSLLAALVVGQLAALWMICSYQVRRAEMRDVSLQVQRVALADCLRYVPRATLNGCAVRVDPGRSDRNAVNPADDQPAAGPQLRTAMSAVVPVRVAYP